MSDKTPEELMQEIVYELRIISSITILTMIITTMALIISCGYILFKI
jgi:hypothetical protein